MPSQSARSDTMQLPTEREVSVAAALIAALGCAGLIFERELGRWPRLRRVLAFALMIAGVASYFQFFAVPRTEFFHRWEMFHYVLGAKYARELSYERLYRCVALVDAEDGLRERVLARPMRDLHDDALIPAASALKQPE